MIKRYSNPEISKIWELEAKFSYWLKVEIAVCKAWQRRGFLTKTDLENIEKKAKFQVERIDEIEEKVQHDLIAFLTNLKENIGEEGRFVHYGLTSSDVVDTALALQIKDSSIILLKKLDELIDTIKQNAIKYKTQIAIGRTHGIHAEPVTLGFKFALFYSELKRNKERLENAMKSIAVGKLSGAVGTFSNIEPEIEIEVCKDLGLDYEKISTQVISRDRHAYFFSVLGIIAGSLDKMAQEIRLMQKSEGREVEEPFSAGQKGSSAMPHKRNPVICERICGLARVIQSNVQVTFRNMALWHERDISHSSAERIIFPDSIIALDYILSKMNYVLKNLHVYPENMKKVLELTKGLIFSQRLLLGLVEKGMQREEAYLIVQKLSMQVWDTSDNNISLENIASKNSEILNYLNQSEIRALFDLNYYLRNIDKIYERLNL